MNFIDSIVNKAKKDIKNIVLPEATDIRILKAASKVVKEKIANIFLIGNKDEIQKIAKKEKIDIKNIEIFDPKTSNKYDLYVEKFMQLSTRFKLTINQEKELLLNPLYFGMMMVKLGDADGLVAGAIHSTKQILQPIMQIFKTKNTKLLSTFCVIEYKNEDFGDKDYTFLISDCALNEDPGYLALSEIAKVTAKSYNWLMEKEPKVAFLSYSTLGSANSKSTEKVKKAAEHLKRKVPNLICDGEMQLDAAIMPEVCKMKAPNSNLNGEANVLIFPDINAGNIAYKIFDRFSNAKMYGPICQGLEMPVNDLSRACSVQRICDTIAITAVQAQEIDKI